MKPHRLFGALAHTKRFGFYPAPDYDGSMLPALLIGSLVLIINMLIQVSALMFGLTTSTFIAVMGRLFARHKSVQALQQ